MARTRLFIEIGTGIELHGQDLTHAAAKAVRDAVSRVCFVMGLHETFRLTGHQDSIISVLVARGHFDPGSGDKSDDIYIANAAVTVLVDAEYLMKTCMMEEEKAPNAG